MYFYSSNGRYQPTAFLAVVALIGEFEKNNYYRTFIEVRRNFEDFLIKNKILVNQVTVKYGSAAKGYARLKHLFSFLIDQFTRGESEEGVVKALGESSEFSFLQPAEKENHNSAKDFNSDAKSAVFLRDALKDPLRCKICGGLIHRNAISIDHIQRRAEGGRGMADNGQLTHPYCNTTVKN